MFRHKQHFQSDAERAIEKERHTTIWRVFMFICTSLCTGMVAMVSWSFTTKIKEVVQAEIGPVISRHELQAREVDARLKLYLELSRYERETRESTDRMKKLEETAMQNRELIRQNQEKILEQLRVLDVKVTEAMAARRENGR